MIEISKGRILFAIREGAKYFTEIEKFTKASPNLVSKILEELEKEGLIIPELDRSSGRRRVYYKLNEGKEDEINRLISLYLQYEKQEVKRGLKEMELVMHYIDFTEEEKKEIAELVEKLKKKLGV
ncbi:MAG: winged helix-turn-helix domain-containing protein [Archaeoglobaceae archaeon]